jgi:hypothetical protein
MKPEPRGMANGCRCKLLRTPARTQHPVRMNSNPQKRLRRSRGSNTTIQSVFPRPESGAGECRPAAGGRSRAQQTLDVELDNPALRDGLRVDQQVAISRCDLELNRPGQSVFDRLAAEIYRLHVCTGFIFQDTKDRRSLVAIWCHASTATFQRFSEIIVEWTEFARSTDVSNRHFLRKRCRAAQVKTAGAEQQRGGRAKHPHDRSR